MANQKHVLVLHDPDSFYYACLISAYLVNEYKIVTIQDLVMGGQPLNMKASVDNAFAVVIIDGRHLFHDTITAYTAEYAQATGKAVFVQTEFLVKDSKFAQLAGDDQILTNISGSQDATFWHLLKDKLKALAHDPNPYL